MNQTEKTIITVSTTVEAAINKVWESWTEPQHIVKWNQASPDWHTPQATNELKVGGKFNSRMEAKDGSQGFDFNGIYLEVEPYERIRYVMEDGREAIITFESLLGGTLVKESFDAENTFSLEIQREGWQAILENFKKYTESLYPMKPLFFSITIHAPAERVIKTMLDAQHYPEWTSVFSEGSYYEGSWGKGAKILFLAPDDRGNSSGMVSQIKENIPNRFISIEHMGIVENGKVITEGPKVEAWQGALENYTFKETKEGTEIIVTLDSEESHRDYFQKTWPKAMDKLKEICEGK